MNLKKKLIIVGVLLALFLVLGFLLSYKKVPIPTNVNLSSDEVHNMLETVDVVLVDVREKGERDAERIDDFGWVQYSHLKTDHPEDWTEIEGIVKAHKTVVIYCAVGERSFNIVSRLREKKYLNVYNLAGGIEEWKQKYPVIEPEEIIEPEELIEPEKQEIEEIIEHEEIIEPEKLIEPEEQKIEEIIEHEEIIEPEEQKIINVPPSLEIEDFYTDKKVYYSNEIMTLTLKINSSQSLEDVGIRIYGILDKWDNYRLNIEQKTNLTSDKNMLDFSYITPSCYGCAGINPGIYEVVSLITYNEISVNKTTSIEIKP